MNPELLGALDQLVEERGISKEILLEAIEAALVSAYRRNFGSVQNVRVHIDRQTGDYKVYAQKTVVEQVSDVRLEASLEEARAKDPSLALGDILEVEVTPRDFGRIAAQTAKQVVVQRIREAERGIIYEEFASREGDIVSGSVLRQDRHSKAVYVELGRVEGVLGAQEQIPGEDFREGQRITLASASGRMAGTATVFCNTWAPWRRVTTTWASCFIPTSAGKSTRPTERPPTKGANSVVSVRPSAVTSTCAVPKSFAALKLSAISRPGWPSARWR